MSESNAVDAPAHPMYGIQITPAGLRHDVSALDSRLDLSARRVSPVRGPARAATPDRDPFSTLPFLSNLLDIQRRADYDRRALPNAAGFITAIAEESADDANLFHRALLSRRPLR